MENGIHLSAAVIIPARYGSTRFAAKILAAQTGRPLVQHVVDQVSRCKKVRQLLDATDDQRIVDALAPFGTRCVMTSADHQSGTDRVAEAAASLPDDIIVNVQGDEPEIEPEIIDSLIERMVNHDELMATAATAFPPSADPADPNLVKVMISQAGRAIYFSRASIPFHRDLPSIKPDMFLHLGIYAYRKAALERVAELEPSPLELVERLAVPLAGSTNVDAGSRPLVDVAVLLPKVGTACARLVAYGTLM